MNRTQVAEVWRIPTQKESAEKQLVDLLARARAEHLSVSIAGARHSMGGHTISPNGILIDTLPFHHLSLDADGKILHAEAGARWSEIVPYLDAQGLSVGVMQSFNDFSVGGSLSVNCHGWQCNRPPIASTVESFRLMKADGEIVRCSRDQNQELFSLALGGYGLFGIVLDADLRVVPNERYREEIEVLPADKLSGRFAEKTRDTPDLTMIYGRLCVVPDGNTFFREAILVDFRRVPGTREDLPPLKPLDNEARRREIYLAQIGNQGAKEFRWKAEKSVGELSAGILYSRNQLFNEGAAVFQEQGDARVEILHEYFLPPTEFNPFLQRARGIISSYPVELLNATIRGVNADRDSFLRYADQDVLSVVLAFSQPRTVDADEQMEKMTRELIDAAINCKGRYYLPYRLHATKEQFDKAYPQAAAFFERKRHFDPGELFQNQFYAKYGRP